MPVAVSLILVVLFLLMNAFFVIAEFSLVRVRKSQLEVALEKGKKGAKNACKIASNINAYLSACQLGITLASLALGWLGEPAFSQLLRPLFNLLGLGDAALSAVSVALGFAIMTALHVVVGELIPKSFAIFSTESYALVTATPLLWFYRLTLPIMWVFNGITNLVVKLVGHDTSSEHDVYTGEEIQLLIDASTENGLIDPEQNEYVDNIFDIGEKDAEGIMTPRMDLVCLNKEDSFKKNLTVVSQYKFTRYPVCEGGKDHIIGFVHVKDLVAQAVVGKASELPIRPIMAVPCGIGISRLLQKMQSEHTEIAMVVDEHGGTAGIVTMSDIMEQFVGRLDDEYRHVGEEDVVKLDDGSLLIDGSISVGEVEDLIGFLPDQAAKCETAGGLVMALLDCIPSEGDETEFRSAPNIEGDVTVVRMTVAEMDFRRIEKINIEVHSEKAAEEKEPTEHSAARS